MGDMEGEIYNMTNYTYNEVVALHQTLKELAMNVRELVTEIKGLRDDLTRK
jgi:hypothetical protein